MKAIIQRVSSANVRVDGEEIGRIGLGLLVLLAAGRGDGPDEVAWMVRKITNLRVFSDDSGRMNLSLKEVGGAALVVSQFTLYGDCRKGTKPSFSRAMEPKLAEPMVLEVLAGLSALGIQTATGRFGANMRVELVNEGPVTLILNTEREG